jgi:hypothetical protein
MDALKELWHRASTSEHDGLRPATACDALTAQVTVLNLAMGETTAPLCMGDARRRGSRLHKIHHPKLRKLVHVTPMTGLVYIA